MEMDVETYFSDYKDINGLKFSMSRSQKVQGQVFQEMHIDKIELNVTIDENVFKQ